MRGKPEPEAPELEGMARQTSSARGAAPAALACLVALLLLGTARATAEGAAAGVASPFKQEAKVPTLFGSKCGDEGGDAAHMKLR